MATATATATATAPITASAASIIAWPDATPSTGAPEPSPDRPAAERSDGAPGTLVGVHFAGDGRGASDVFGGAGMTGWAVELAYATDGAPEAIARRLVGLHERGFRVILRVDHARGQNIPPVADASALAAYVDYIGRVVSATGGRLRHVVVGNEGNIDEDGNDPARNSECRLGRESCAPAAYAQVYRAVRDAVGAGGRVRVLVAGVSPGDEDHPARWMSGPDYLTALLGLLGPGQVDGVALHAYGLEREPVPGLPADPLGYFQGLMNRQLSVMAASGHGRTPVYITEMNEYTRPEAKFVRAAYAWLDGLSRGGRARIMAACWFVFDGGPRWEDVALVNRPDIAAILREVAADYPPAP